MFKAMIFGFIVGALAGQAAYTLAFECFAEARSELNSLLHIDAYSKVSAALS
jgi:hypothetical protein